MMTAAVRIVGASAGAVWLALSAIVLFLTFAISPPATSLITIAFAVVPPLLVASALWVAFGSGFRTTKLALAIELLHLVAGAVLLVIVSAASGG